MAQVKKVGVVGAGNMGSGIVQKLAQEGFDVVMLDMKSEFVARGRERIRTLLGEAVERKIFRPEQVEQILDRIHGTTEFADLADCDLVIEAVFEDEGVKKDVFGKLDEACGDGTILATNTSSFYVTSLAKATGRPDRFVGLHYFYHPAKNRLLEVIAGEKTGPDTVSACLSFAKRMGKVPILCKDRPGFVVNRFFVPWLNESVRLLENGVADIPTIEAAAKKAFKIGMGPFELMNVTGVPIALHAETTLGQELGSYYPPVDRLKEQVEAGENWDLSGEPDPSKFEAVSDRLLGVVFQIAGELLDEQVCSLEDVDRGAKIGLRWALGPFELMNRLGVDKAVVMARKFADGFGHPLSPSLAAQVEAGGPWPIRVVDVAVHDGIATLTINRPEAMNALNEQVVLQFEQVFDETVARGDVKAVVIEGAGKAFVAGADIKFFVDHIKADTIPEIVSFTRKGQSVLRKLETSPKPVIAKVDGLSLGGGSELALACQAVVVTEKGSFGFPETGIGIYPGLGGTQRTPRMVGKAVARYLILTGRPVDAQTAYDLGLATHLTDTDHVDAFIRELVDNGVYPDKYASREVPADWQTVAEAFGDDKVAAVVAGAAPNDDRRVVSAVKAIGRKAPLAVGLVNKLIDEGTRLPLEEGLELELSHLTEIFTTEDALAGLGNVGRRTEFKGR